jgi:hypothetical protein
VKKDKNKKRGEGEGALRDATFVTEEKTSGPEDSHTMPPRLCGKALW